MSLASNGKPLSGNLIARLDRQRAFGRLSRKKFLSSMFSAGVMCFAGRGFAAIPVMRQNSKARLRFGLISDIHISEWSGGGLDCKTFLETLRYFRDRGCEAVVIAGDLTNFGLVEELEFVAKAWYDVFPNDRAPDGRHVEKVFIGGNHDWEGWKYGKAGERKYPDRQELAAHRIMDRYAEIWRRVFREDFSKQIRKEVKGYVFLGAHWPWHDEKCAEWLAKEAATLDSGRPFFYVQHPHPRGTVYAMTDDVETDPVTKALSRFGNAVAFSGHSHRSLTNERSIWQGGFTSVATATLRNVGAIEGYENSGPRRNSEFKQMPYFERTARQGQFVTVYDDRIVFERREFTTGKSLGPDWVVPLSLERPYAYSSRKHRLPKPAFPKAAVVTIGEEYEGANRGKVPCRQVKVTFPAALPASASVGRANAYEVQVLQTQGDFTDLPLLTKRVYGGGYGFAEEDGAKTVELVLNAGEIPHECFLEITATALDSFGNRSEKISSGRTKLPGVVVRW